MELLTFSLAPVLLYIFPIACTWKRHSFMGFSEINDESGPQLHEKYLYHFYGLNMAMNNNGNSMWPMCQGFILGKEKITHAGDSGEIMKEIAEGGYLNI